MNTLYFECIESCINNYEIVYSMPLILIFVEEKARGGRGWWWWRIVS
jgi:hypothetical protein